MMAVASSSSNETSVAEDEHMYTTCSPTTTNGKFLERNPVHFCDCPSCLSIPFREWGACAPATEATYED